MSNFKNNITILCTLFVMLFSAAIATPYRSPEVYRTDLMKEYIRSDSLVFQDGHMFVIDGEELVHIDALHQDEEGLFIVWSPYGTCPYGHPYPAQGGCYYPGCPCSD